MRFTPPNALSAQRQELIVDGTLQIVKFASCLIRSLLSSSAGHGVQLKLAG